MLLKVMFAASLSNMSFENEIVPAHFDHLNVSKPFPSSVASSGYVSGHG
jgi:hypothetical protein